MTGNYDTSDSSDSSDEDISKATLRAICDPSFNFSNEDSNKKSSYKKLKISSVGDEELDGALQTLLSNIQSADSTFKTAVARPVSTCLHVRSSNQYYPSDGSSASKPLAPRSTRLPYLKRKFDEIVSKQFSVRESNDSPTSNDADCPQDETVLLLPSVSVIPSAENTKLIQTKKDHERWLNKLRKRPKSFDEESTVEGRCRDIAICGHLIYNGGLRHPYTEFKNSDPRKVDKMKLMKSVGNVLHVFPVGTNFNSHKMNEQSLPPPSNCILKTKKLPLANKIPDLHSKCLTNLSEAMPKPLPSNGESKELMPSSEAKKKRARARGPKKKKTKTD